MATESTHDNSLAVAASVAVRDLVFPASEPTGTVFLLYDVQTDQLTARGNQG